MGRGLIKIENLIARIGEFFFERSVKTFIARMKKFDIKDKNPEGSDR